MSIKDYLEDWEKFRNYIEKKAKDRCYISNKNWGKLRDYHLEQFVKKVSYPYGFLFKMIYLNKMHREIPSIFKLYYKYKRKNLNIANIFRLKTRIDAYRRKR
jgi:hypothetical protein